MNTIPHIAAKALSVILYPMFIPTYGMALYCSVLLSRMQHTESSVYVWLVLCGGTFVFTCLLPMLCIGWLVWRKHVSGFTMSDRRERRLPYIVTAMSYVAWFFSLKTLFADSSVPNLLLPLVAMGALIALTVVLLINRRWKISAHLTAMGGLLGAVVGYGSYASVLPIDTLCLLTVLSLFLMYARLYLGEHTPLQVVAGFVLGIVSVSLPVLVVYA